MSESLVTGERVTPLGHRLDVLPSREAVLDAAADRFLETLVGMPAGGRIVLAGGSTPLPLYERLAVKGRSRNWNAHWYLTSDERCVPPEHSDSNFGRISKALWKPLGVDSARIIRFPGEKPPDRAAEVAHRELVDLAQRVPLFDLVLLGLGEDGHVASLFPEATWPDFGMHLAAATRHPDGSDRVTLTPRALRSSRRTWFLVTGRGKKDAVLRTLTAGEASPSVPALMVTGDEVRWFLDAEAAAGLPDTW